jgi:lipocalin
VASDSRRSLSRHARPLFPDIQLEIVPFHSLIRESICRGISAVGMRLPVTNRASKKGAKGVTADYSLRADGSIDVLNRCRKPDGKSSEARGRAKVVDGDTKSKLKVSFFGPFYGDYWILDHADDYRWSIVGEPSGRYLWILDREATPADAEVAKLIERARELGYDTSMLLRTKQP